MIILASILIFALIICDIMLITYCRVRKRSLFAFSLFIILLAIVSLMLTGDITIAYGGLK